MYKYAILVHSFLNSDYHGTDNLKSKLCALHAALNSDRNSDLSCRHSYLNSELKARHSIKISIQNGSKYTCMLGAGKTSCCPLAMPSAHLRISWYGLLFYLLLCRRACLVSAHCLWNRVCSHFLTKCTCNVTLLTTGKIGT